MKRVVLIAFVGWFFFIGVEVKASSDNLVFVILTHVRSENENKLWKRCHASIREFYPDTQIVIINDNSKKFFLKKKLNNTVVIKSDYPGAGELLPYYYFLKYKWASKMVFLHDSMFLKRKFSDAELDHKIKFHWCFGDHSADDDMRIDALLGKLQYSDDLISYNHEKSLWNGCFGVTSIIDLSLLITIENKYGLTASLIDQIKCRNDRMALERIFAIVMFKEGSVTGADCSNFGSIFDYPGCWEKVGDNFLDYLKTTYPGAILKTWHGR